VIELLAMIVCPLCEHAQAETGDCEICGKRLAGVLGTAPGVVPIEGLEPTGHAAAWPPAAPPVEGLEPTSHAPAGEVAPPPLEIEPTRAAPLDVDGPAMDGLERTASEIPGDGPTPLAVFVTCRYCRTPALPGERICSRCGMRLPVAAGPRGAGAEVGRVCGCGALVRGGACPICGARPPVG
jgi:hypothetical protein